MPRPRGIPGPPDADDARVVHLPWRRFPLRGTRGPRLRSDESGFTLIEAVIAMALFAIVATALAGVLTSSIDARAPLQAIDRGRADRQQPARVIRSISYANVGLTVNGNPSGIVNASGNQAAQGGPTVPAGWTVAIKISWVDDSIPTSPATRANYKNVTVTVTRTRDSKQMTQQSTQIGPRQRAPYGGINKGIVNAQVQDYFTAAPMPGVLVNLNNGPSSPLADTTDSGGLLRFPALDPATGSTYYDLVVAPFNGYILLPNPAATHFQIAAASSTPLKVLQVYKPVTLTAQFKNSDGTDYAGTLNFTVSSSRARRASPTRYARRDHRDHELHHRHVRAARPRRLHDHRLGQAAASFYTDPVTQSDPENLSDYPSDLSATATVTADPLGSMSVNVTSAGGPVSGATVTVSGGPRSIATRTATTNASGVASFTSLPAGPATR